MSIKNKSDAECVKEFTLATGFKVPDNPHKMTKDEVFFLTKMIIDEIMELTSTVAESKESKEILIKMINDSKNIKQCNSEISDIEIIAQQVDFVVDVYYYSLNAMAKCGINASTVFNLVHTANMNKRDPVTKLFIRRAEDNKILKPNGWIEADVNGEIKRQIEEGSWN